MLKVAAIATRYMDTSRMYANVNGDIAKPEDQTSPLMIVRFVMLQNTYIRAI